MPDLKGSNANMDELAFTCRFLFDTGAPARVFEEALRADMRAAHLSPAFHVYYRLRSFIPLPVRRLLQRCRAVHHAPDWYLPREFHEALADVVGAAGVEGVPTIHPWPDDALFAFVPTHDVETAEGLRRVEQIADLEEKLGIRSAWNIVPHKYPVDLGLIRDLQARGFEIGVHGYNHDGRLFTSGRVFERRLPAMNDALVTYRSVGFRAPMVHRNLEWLQKLKIEYDGSHFDVDPYQAMPGGVGGVWPFIAGRFVELPYTLPQDHTLFVALGERDGRIWEKKLDYVAALGGMALIVTHPDYLDSDLRIDAYRRLLERVLAMNHVWLALPGQVADWWRHRDQSDFHELRGEWSIQGPAAGRGRVAVLRLSQIGPIDVDSASHGPHGSPNRLPKFEWHDLPMTHSAREAIASQSLV